MARTRDAALFVWHGKLCRWGQVSEPVRFLENCGATLSGRGQECVLCCREWEWARDAGHDEWEGNCHADSWSALQ